MPFGIHRPRQVVGLIYTAVYLSIFFVYLFVWKDDSAPVATSVFAATVFIWFVLSLAVKVSMAVNRLVELVNLMAVLAFLMLGFSYNPYPAPTGFADTSIGDFCYYLHLAGGAICDVCDFVYESAAKPAHDA